MGAPVQNSPALSRRGFAAAQALWANAAPMLTRWLSCTIVNSVPRVDRHRVIDVRASRGIAGFCLQSRTLAPSPAPRSLCLTLTISRGTTSNASQQLEHGSTRRIHRRADPTDAAGLPNDGPRSFHDLPRRSRAPVPVPGADRCRCCRVGRVGGTELGGGTHPASPCRAGFLPVATAPATNDRARPYHCSGAAALSASVSSANSCIRICPIDRRRTDF